MAFQGYTMPPPYNGLDLVSAIDNMEPTYALELVNVFPGAGSPTVRNGYSEYVAASSLAGSVPILFMDTLHKADGTSELVLATQTKLYRITETATVTDITSVPAHTNGEFQSIVFGNRMYLCNGVDNAKVYSGTGTAATDLTFTGVTLSTLVNVNAYKERLYFVEKNSARFWYGEVQVTGTGGSPALTSFDLQYVFTKGGRLLFTSSYTNQFSQSSQSLFMAVSSEGEIVFYTGSYAGDVNTWGLVARYFIGRPLGYRAFIRINNDIWILTQQGIVPVSSLFQMDPEQALNVVSQRINPLITEFANINSFDHEWTGFFWPAGRRVYVNVPSSSSTSFFLVYSLDTKAWTKFALSSETHGISSCVFKNLPFYASNTGNVWQGETGQADALLLSGGTGDSIVFSYRGPFSFYESRGNYKAYKDIRPLIKAKRGVTFNIGLDTDFKKSQTVSTVTSSPGYYTAWGSAWGIGAGTLSTVTGLPLPTVFTPWSSDVEYIFDRFAVKGQGHCAAIRAGGSIKNSTCQFFGFEIRFDLGGQV